MQSRGPIVRDNSNWQDCSAPHKEISCNRDRLQAAGDTSVEEGLYKVHFHTVHGTGSGVVYAINGKIRGGNSAFAFLGSYSGPRDKVSVKVSTQRYNEQPAFKPLFGTDRITLTLNGAVSDDMVDLEGTALQLPGLNFKAVLTRISD